MSQDDVQRSGFSPGQDWMCLPVVAQKPNFGDVCRQGWPKPGDEMPQTGELCALIPIFIWDLWKHKRSHSAAIQFFSSTNPGQWSSTAFVAAKNLCAIVPMAAGLQPWARFGQLCLAPQPSPFADPAPHQCGANLEPAMPWSSLGSCALTKTPQMTQQQQHWPEFILVTLFDSNTDQVKKVPGAALGKAEPDSDFSSK